MHSRIRDKGIVFITIFIFICFTLIFECSFGEEKSTPEKVQNLYRQGNSSENARFDLACKEQVKNDEEKDVNNEIETTQTRSQEKEKPIPQIHKKRFPWVMAILSVGVVALLIVFLAKRKKDTQTQSTTYSNGILHVGDVAYEMKMIPAGEFQMGGDYEKPIHKVRITRDFWLGKTEVTQRLWHAVMASNPSHFKNDINNPVERVSWNRYQQFISNLNQRLKKNCFRLPTEAEWEYACRAGTTGDCYGDIDSIAWYESNSGDTTHPVGQKLANPWGLYDMLGNVLEWCQDWYGEDYYSQSPYEDPTGPPTGILHVIRGGCWHYKADLVRSSFRESYGGPDSYIDWLGFRLAANSAGN